MDLWPLECLATPTKAPAGEMFMTKGNTNVARTIILIFTGIASHPTQAERHTIRRILQMSGDPKVVETEISLSVSRGSITLP
jgi:hypothetical protein